MTAFKRLRDLTDLGLGSHDDIDLIDVDLDNVLSRAAKVLEDADENGVFQVRILSSAEPETRTPHYYRIEMTKGSAETMKGRFDKPDFEILTTARTFSKMVRGSYSPLDAYLDGEMRIRGDADLGKRILAHLGEPEGTVSAC